MLEIGGGPSSDRGEWWHVWFAAGCGVVLVAILAGAWWWGTQERRAQLTDVERRAELDRMLVANVAADVNAALRRGDRRFRQVGRGGYDRPRGSNAAEFPGIDLTDMTLVEQHGFVSLEPLIRRLGTDDREHMGIVERYATAYNQELLKAMKGELVDAAGR